MLRPDTVQSQTDGPTSLAVENFKDIVTEGDTSKDAPMPAFYDSETLTVLSPSPSALPVLSSSPSEWPSQPAFPVLSSSPPAFPVLSPSQSAFPVLSSSPPAFPVLSPSQSAFPIMSSPPALPVLWSPSSEFPVLSPSAGPAIESLLQPWSVESVTKEESYYFPFLHPAVDSWKHDCTSNSNAFLGATIINNTSLVFRASLPGSPIHRPLSSCSHRSCNDEDDRVVNLPPHYQQDATSLYGRDAVERSPEISSSCQDQPTEQPLVQEQRADCHQCRFCPMKFGRKPDCKRHEKYTCNSNNIACIVCKKDLCRRDSLMRHLNRTGGNNPCAMVLEVAKISNNAVALRRVSREHLGTDSEIEEALRTYEKFGRVGPSTK